MRRLPVSVLLVGLSSLSFAQYAGSVPPPAAQKVGFESINQKDGREFLGYLAGPETQGRGTGQPGFQKAAEYVAGKLKGWGIKPLGDNGTYFQNMPFYRSRIDPGSVSVELAGKKASIGSDMALSGATEAFTVEGKAVVLRTGGAALAEPAVLKDAIVIIVGTQSRDLMRQFAGNRPKLILNLRKTVAAGEWSPTRTAPTAGARANIRGSITEAGVKKLASSVKKDISLATPAATVSEATELGDIKISGKGMFEEVGVPNVVGILEGSDPTLKAETVGIGAHLDHLGVTGGVVYPGADDDASGSTAVLQIAKAFSTNPVKPKRSIIFMWFCGEERGLLGSAYYSDNPKMPHDKMIAEIQMDMVGRDSDGVQNGDPSRVDKADENRDTIRLVGTKKISNEIDDIIQRLNQHTKFKFKYDAEDVYTRSDHYNFAKVGIPIAFFFDGFHPDYHQPTDTADKINYEKIANAAKLGYLTAAELADRSGPLKRNTTGN
ncbi:Iap Predicted aminopeptidases [Fimbriimonadaceae bacterium]